MLRTRVIPVLLLKNNGLVKTTRFKNPVYVGDPINAVKIFNEKEVDELILLDITATNEKRQPSYSQIREIVSEAFMPIGYGGGVNKIEQIEKLFNIGIEKVVINTALHTNPNLVTQASQIFGSQSIVAAIDLKKSLFGGYSVLTHSGKVKQKLKFELLVNKVQELGAGEIFLNSIDKDGTMQGYDLDLIEKISRLVNIPTIASGGASNLEDFAHAIKAGASAVAAGAMFVFHGKHRAVLISYPKYEDFLNHLKIT